MQQSKDQCLEITETFEDLVEEAENNSKPTTWNHYIKSYNQYVEWLKETFLILKQF